MRATTFLSGLLLTTAVFAAPTPRAQGQDITDSNPFNVDERRDVGSGVGGVTAPVTNVVNEVETTVKGLGVPIPDTNSLPVRQLEGITGAVTTAVSPVTNMVSSLLSSALTSLTSADASVQTLVTDLKANAADIVSEIEADLTSGQSQLTDLVSSMETEGSSMTTDATALVGQVKTTANTLLLDLEKVEDSVPGVSSLITTVKSVIATVSGLGL